MGQEIEAILDGGIDENAAINKETHNIGEVGESMHAAQCGGTAFDAVECRAESELSDSAEEHCGEEATANRETTFAEGKVFNSLELHGLQVSQQPAGILSEYFEFNEYVNMHETEESTLVQNLHETEESPPCTQ